MGDGATDPDFEEYRAEVLQALREGWIIVAEGPTGAQLKGRRKVRVVTGLLGAIGVCLFVLVDMIVGGVFLLLALINHALTKEPTRFIPR